MNKINIKCLIRKMNCLIAGTCVLILAIACKDGNSQKAVDPAAGSAPPNSSPKPVTTCTAFPANSPILRQGDLFSGATWNDPHVFKEGLQYVMYASADTNFNADIKIYRLISNDGINWALSPAGAVFQKSAVPGAWDSTSTETPAVVFFNGLYYLFYTGYNGTHLDVSTYKVGYATSPDGINWTRQAAYLAPSAPNAGAPNFDFHQYVVGEPGPVVFNNKIYLYFTAIGYDLTTNSIQQSIGLVTSADGLNWSSAQKVLSPDQSIYPAASWFGYSTPNAVVSGGKIHLFFDVIASPIWKQVKLHHAVSSDGIHWIQDGTAIFDKSRFSWTATEINSPSVLLDGTQLKMWFAGNDPTPTLSIGYATCTVTP